MTESTGGEVNRYKYNGKELDRITVWTGWTMVLAGWTACVSPRPTHWQASISPYAYCADNPVRLLIKASNPQHI